MKVIQFAAQIQMGLEDGSSVLYTTPPLTTKGALNEDDIRNAIMSLGLTQQQAMTQQPHQEHASPILRPSPADGISGRPAKKGMRLFEGP